MAEDHTIVRRGIVSLLSLKGEFVVVAEAADGRSAVEEAVAKEPDIVLMDIGMPILNGLEATRQIKRQVPATKVLVLSGYDNEEYILQVIQSGASGYLLKDTDPEGLCTAIKTVMNGNAFFSPVVSKVLLDEYIKRGTAQRVGADGGTSAGTLTEREREILQLIAEGKSHQQIGEMLHISVRTVDTHRNNIVNKLDLHDTASLVMYAIKNGIVILPR